MDSKNANGQSSRGRGPPLPPRQPSSSSLHADAPPSYDSIAHSAETAKGPWSTQDSRTSSTQSLVPSLSNAQNERRRLLLIYIHGFMGNETSFRSFPAHVHHLLTVLLAETHVVHTKLYPRYRSKRNISFARDDFSKWLEPHEDATTDVVLLGHSMGGLLSAEVVLMPPAAPANRPFKHRILGTINFDVPFLGMHPGVVKSGLASMFLPDEPQQDKYLPEMQDSVSENAGSAGGSTMSPLSAQSSRSDTLWQPDKQDPNFNPSFNNDVVLPMRKGWANTLHFFNKHRDNVFKATKQLVTSHMEFGGAMANYPELKARYGRVRVLEEEDGNLRKSIVKNGQVPTRVRFVNYYTASTGRLKKAKSPVKTLSPSANVSRTSLSPSDAERGRPPTSGSLAQTSRSQSPRISLEEHSDEGVVKKIPEIPTSEDEDWQEAAESLTIGDSNNTRQTTDPETPVLSPTSTLSTTTSLQTMPDPPTKPPPLDLSYISDPNTRKLVEQEHTKAVKAYEKALKDRQKAIENVDRKARKDSDSSFKAAEKAERKQAEQAALEAKQKEPPTRELTHSEREHLRLEQERQRMEAEGRRMRGEPEPAPQPTSTTSAAAPTTTPPTSVPSASPSPPPLDYSHPLSQPQSTSSTRSPSPASDPATSVPNTTTDAQKKPKKQKDRMFCSLPPADSAGERDPLWVRVFMQNVDEVGAHCGLFFVDERYERLVGEVAGRVEGWVRERAW